VANRRSLLEHRAVRRLCVEIDDTLYTIISEADVLADAGLTRSAAFRFTI
jgi:hypothetical protein